MTVEQCVEEFYSMPPALRRKLFSNVERFRLEQLRQQQLDGGRNRPATSSSTRLSFSSDTTSGSFPTRYRHDSASSRPRLQPNRRKVLFLNTKAARRLRKPTPVEVPYFVTKAEAEWFRSLPSKVQQLHFSPDEQARLAGTWCRPTSIILDSADKALYRLGGQQRRHSIASVSSAPTLNSDASTMTSSNGNDSAIDMADVYDSFRWMDEEEELDLNLYDYHHHIAEISKPHPRRPRDSFRRTFSFHSLQGSGRSTPTSVRPSLKKSATERPGLSPIHRHNRSFSRSFSSNPIFKPPQQPAEPSLDRPAQYYQDPEARLKLRVYLASPQKFDEAVEFGFPSLEYRRNSSTNDNNNSNSNQSPSRSTSRSKRPSEDHSTRNSDTFLQSHSTLPTERPNTPNEPLDLTSTTSISSTPTTKPIKPTIVRPSRLSQHLSGGREMTLKMTLTRADLRTDVDATGSGAVSNSVRTSRSDMRLGDHDDDDAKSYDDDPLRLADLPPVGGRGPVWDEPDQGGVVRKMWSRLKRRR